MEIKFFVKKSKDSEKKLAFFTLNTLNSITDFSSQNISITSISAKKVLNFINSNEEISELEINIFLNNLYELRNLFSYSYNFALEFMKSVQLQYNDISDNDACLRWKTISETLIRLMNAVYPNITNTEYDFYKEKIKYINYFILKYKNYIDIKFYFTEFLFIISDKAIPYANFVEKIPFKCHNLIYNSKNISREKDMFDNIMNDFEFDNIDNMYYHSKKMFIKPVTDTIKVAHLNTKYGESLCVPILFYDNSNIDKNTIIYNLDKITGRTIIDLSDCKYYSDVFYTILHYIDPYHKNNYDILEDF